jgi:hypothetical protein
VTIDLRTRWDDDVPVIDPVRFLDADLPAACTRETELLASASHLDLRPVEVVVDGSSWTLWRDDAGTPRVARTGSISTPSAQEIWTLTSDQVADLVTDQVTPVGLLTGGALQLQRGRIARVMDWWLVLRCVLDRRPVYAPGSLTVGADLGRSFTLDDDPASLRNFLVENGFLHLRGVYDEREMAAISADMDACAPAHTEGDGRSWWATLEDGTRRVVRMQGFDERSPAAAAILADDRLDRIGGVVGVGHERRTATANRIEALFKPIGVTDGISDVPWHKDCSLGRHSYECCALTIGISVTGAGPRSGQLRVIPGSHRALVWPSLLDPSTLGLPDVALPTETGDVTVHLSCTLHRAEPPTERERKVLYTGLRLVPRDPAAAAAARRRMVEEAREQAPLTMSQAQAPSSRT